MDLSGIVTVLNTPFTDGNEVDLPSLTANVQYALEAGVAGFLVPAMAGEVDKLSESERITIVETVLETVGGTVPVVGGASAVDRRSRLRMAATLKDLGCDGILVSVPYESDSQYTADVLAVADLQAPLLMLQDVDFNGYGLPVPLIVHLFEIGAIQSLKVEVVPAGTKYTEVREATNGKLHLAGGWAVPQMIEALDRGVNTMMPTAMHRTYVHVYQLYSEGDRDAAKTLFNRLLPVIAFANQHLDVSVHFFKQLLYRQGIYRTPGVRDPILPFDSIHRRLADELIQLAMELEENE